MTYRTYDLDKETPPNDRWFKCIDGSYGIRFSDGHMASAHRINSNTWEVELSNGKTIHPPSFSEAKRIVEQELKP